MLIDRLKIVREDDVIQCCDDRGYVTSNESGPYILGRDTMYIISKTGLYQLMSRRSDICETCKEDMTHQSWSE